jgi:outer membrane protein insertion porin family
LTAAGRVRLTLVGVLALVLLVPPVAPVGAQQQPPIVIRELGVEGNRRVQEAVILGRVKSTIGGPFNASQVSEDVRSVFGLGFFDDVQLRVEDFEGGVRVTFIVVERPFIRDVEFVGNTKNTSDLLEKIDLKLGAVYNPVDVQAAREKLKDFYEDEGYFEVQITPQTEKFADGDVKVVFSINEGRVMKIDKILIHGNKGLSDREIKKAMATQERQYFILRGTVQRQRLEEDVERVIGVYNDHGYVQARVESHDVTVDRDKARVTINITVVEGAQYRVGDLAVNGVTLLPDTEIRRQLKFKAGDVFSRAGLRESVQNITDLYSTIGRASADVSTRTEQTAANRINVTLDVVEGPEVYVERININGNVRSQDKILRRELPMVEGDLFTLQKLQRARQKLVNLGYFETVNATTQAGADKSKIVVNIDVTERPTGIFSIGGGYSSVDSFIGTLDLTQNNFLGRGWQVSLRLRGGANTQQGIISFTEPWLFDRPLSAGFDLYDTKRKFSEYDYDTLGGNVRFSHPFEEYWRWNLGYRLSQDRISNLANNQDNFLADEVGTRVTSMIQAALTRDSRDSFTATTRGGQTSLGVDFAGLGGDNHYVKAVASQNYFKPIWFDHVLSARAEVGYGFGLGKENLPVFERFYLGGPNSIRGFKNRRISPVDEQGTRIGGTTELLGNVEYLVPLPFNIRVAGFFDIGNVYGFRTKFDPTDLREAAGGGVRWLSPFGPIRVDYGVNLNRRKGEDFGAFHFSVGSPF